ncbi:MAG: hypothetical protein PHF17_11275 [Arcobacteraceae bacterium]|nr:hypothetical protein [Arcobacteraceae bacterium]
MTINIEKIIENSSPPPLFCPFCKALYVNNQGYLRISALTYKCLECNDKKIFSNDTYKNETLNGKKFHINQDTNEFKVDNFIFEKVLELANTGLSQKRIHEITHFSRAKIRQLLEPKSNPPKIFTFKEFLVEIGCDEEELEIYYNKKRGAKSFSVVNNFVKKALEYGCNYLAVAKLFKIGKKRISSINTNSAYRQNVSIKILDDEMIQVIKKEYVRKSSTS